MPALDSDLQAYFGVRHRPSLQGRGGAGQGMFAVEMPMPWPVRGAPALRDRLWRRCELVLLQTPLERKRLCLQRKHPDPFCPAVLPTTAVVLRAS